MALAILFNVNCIFNYYVCPISTPAPSISHVAVLYNLLYALFSGSIVHNHRQ